jgi:pSer/pThr/pTyr-binding forkhead associated (FHA) protein
MSFQCPKGHISTDPDYCSECGAKIGKSSLPNNTNDSQAQSTVKEEICPDCGTPRVGTDRFCEVCRYDFTEGKTGTAEKVVAASQPPQAEVKEEPKKTDASPSTAGSKIADEAKTASLSQVKAKDDIVIGEKLNIVISVDKNRLAENQIESNIKPDSVDRVFPLDLDENLVGRRSAAKGIYPEIEINDPGVSHRHLKFIKQGDGTFAILELGSANGTEHNGVQLVPGVSTVIKAGDEFAIGLWTTLKVVSR